MAEATGLVLAPVAAVGEDTRQVGGAGLTDQRLDQ